MSRKFLPPDNTWALISFYLWSHTPLWACPWKMASNERISQGSLTSGEDYLNLAVILAPQYAAVVPSAVRSTAPFRVHTGFKKSHKKNKALSAGMPLLASASVA